jgi:hypothetical protein
MQNESAAKMQSTVTAEGLTGASQDIIGKYFLGTTAAMNPGLSVNYVWGKILESINDGKRWFCGFYEWKQNVPETELGFKANLSAEQMDGWDFFETVPALNQAVIDLAKKLNEQETQDADKQ